VDSDRQATAPLTMGNSEAPVSAGDDAASTGGHLEVTRVRVDGWDGPAQWFGAPARRKLSVTVRNTGDQTLHDPPLSAGFGKGGEHKALVTGPAIGDLGPGQTRTVAISVALKPFAVGSYHVGGSVGEGPEAATFDESVRTFPWGWLVVLAFIAFRLVQSFRRKKRGAGQDHQDDLDEMLPIDLRDAPQRSTAGDAEPVPVDAPTGPFPFVLSDDDRDIRATVSANGNGRRPFQPAAGSSAKADATPAFGDGPPFGSRRAPIPVWEPSTPAAATEPADTQQPRVDAPQPFAQRFRGHRTAPTWAPGRRRPRAAPDRISSERRAPASKRSSARPGRSGQAAHGRIDAPHRRSPQHAAAPEWTGGHARRSPVRRAGRFGRSRGAATGRTSPLPSTRRPGRCRSSAPAGLASFRRAAARRGTQRCRARRRRLSWPRRHDRGRPLGVAALAATGATAPLTELGAVDSVPVPPERIGPGPAVARRRSRTFAGEQPGSPTGRQPRPPGRQRPGPGSHQWPDRSPERPGPAAGRWPGPPAGQRPGPRTAEGPGPTRGSGPTGSPSPGRPGAAGTRREPHR
jgi:hypothetical protein